MSKDLNNSDKTKKNLQDQAKINNKNITQRIKSLLAMDYNMQLGRKALTMESLSEMTIQPVENEPNTYYLLKPIPNNPGSHETISTIILDSNNFVRCTETNKQKIDSYLKQIIDSKNIAQAKPPVINNEAVSNVPNARSNSTRNNPSNQSNFASALTTNAQGSIIVPKNFPSPVRITSYNGTQKPTISNYTPPTPLQGYVPLNITTSYNNDKMEIIINGQPVKLQDMTKTNYIILDPQGRVLEVTTQRPAFLDNPKQPYMPTRQANLNVAANSRQANSPNVNQQGIDASQRTNNSTGRVQASNNIQTNPSTPTTVNNNTNRGTIYPNNLASSTKVIPTNSFSSTNSTNPVSTLDSSKITDEILHAREIYVARLHAFQVALRPFNNKSKDNLGENLQQLRKSYISIANASYELNRVYEKHRQNPESEVQRALHAARETSWTNTTHIKTDLNDLWKKHNIDLQGEISHVKLVTVANEDLPSRDTENIVLRNSDSKDQQQTTNSKALTNNSNNRNNSSQTPSNNLTNAAARAQHQFPSNPSHEASETSFQLSMAFSRVDAFMRPYNNNYEGLKHFLKKGQPLNNVLIENLYFNHAVLKDCLEDTHAALIEARKLIDESPHLLENLGGDYKKQLLSMVKRAEKDLPLHQERFEKISREADKHLEESLEVRNATKEDRINTQKKWHKTNISDVVDDRIAKTDQLIQLTRQMETAKIPTEQNISEFQKHANNMLKGEIDPKISLEEQKKMASSLYNKRVESVIELKKAIEATTRFEQENPDLKATYPIVTTAIKQLKEAEQLLAKEEKGTERLTKKLQSQFNFDITDPSKPQQERNTVVGRILETAKNIGATIAPGYFNNSKQKQEKGATVAKEYNSDLESNNNSTQVEDSKKTKRLSQQLASENNNPEIKLPKNYTKTIVRRNSKKTGYLTPNTGPSRVNSEPTKGSGIDY